AAPEAPRERNSMTTHMLIDARHAEETRVSVITNGRLDEFDYETASKAQIKGNIYLAKITRVEPSLQAAFIEYGGNRQGFLAFSEIHPDYYQIPIEDREALLAEEEDAGREEDRARDAFPAAETAPEAANGAAEVHGENIGPKKEADDFSEEGLARKRRARALKRRYRIQEVIKKRQVILVQVVKEERGTKGAAMTTYLSLPGRYCVLMPNTTHGHGISRKIGDGGERQRLRKILEEMKVPQGMGAIIRTVGQGRTKAEIKRDLDYLLKAWEDIREQTLKASAPALIFEEGNLIKRSLRDLYDKHFDEVLVEGEGGFETARNFMKQLIPAHVKKVKLYQDKVPLFHKFAVEEQIDSLFAPIIHLRSGGYVVINPTEALVAIDVNSGRATREHNIEETALQTNLEAAEEIARQLRLRDIAGLIVIDFIDMEHFSNNKTIEKRFRDALRADRARIFTSRISQLGLLEMSRQRLRASLYEISTQPCPHCQGSGRIASIDTLALRVLRQAEDMGLKGGIEHVVIQAPQELALYLLNTKRKTLDAMEARFAVKLMVAPSLQLKVPNFAIRGLRSDEMQRELEAGTLFSSTPAMPSAAVVPQRLPRPEGFGRTEPGQHHDQGRRRGRRGRRGGRRHRFDDHRFPHEAHPRTDAVRAMPTQAPQAGEPPSLQPSAERAAPPAAPAPHREQEITPPAKAETPPLQAETPRTKGAAQRRSPRSGRAQASKKLPAKKEATEAKTPKAAEPKKRAGNPRKGWWQRAIGK
ncbi:MAG TPA: ribonuclease E/G, partial [Sphingomonadales bacterium]|nr:ribonuclease E/G [Sphingomonadales bacterium]